MLREKLDELIASSMKEQNNSLLNTYRLIKAEFVNAEKKNGKSLTESDEVSILLKMVAQHEDSISQYTGAGRQDLADKEKEELEIIKTHLPAIAGDEEISEYTAGVITAYKLTKNDGYVLSMKDMKPIMDEVKKKYPSASGKVISQTLSKIINR